MVLNVTEETSLRNHEIADQGVQDLDQAFEPLFRLVGRADKLDRSEAPTIKDDRHDCAEPAEFTPVPMRLWTPCQFGKMELPGLATEIALRMIPAGRMTRVRRWILVALERRKSDLRDYRSGVACEEERFDDPLPKSVRQRHRLWFFNLGQGVIESIFGMPAIVTTVHVWFS
ncbi:MAG: hypothetical protein AABZ12_11250 [Planctomycetota bacterium]